MSVGNLEQLRASCAYQHLSDEVIPLAENDRKTYGTLALKLPALLRSSGLCQTVHFIGSRGKVGANLLLDHLGRQLRRIDPQISERNSLCKQAREADAASYLWLSREAIALANWYSRLTRSVLGIEPGEEA